MSSYFYADVCNLELSDNQRVLLGFEGKSNEDLGIGEFCLTQDMIISHFVDKLESLS